MQEAVNAARRYLQEALSVLVVTHIRPDGDAIGSLLALGLSLEAAGKNVQMVLADGVPSSFRFLQGSDKIRLKVEHMPGGFDLIAIVDASELSRVGKALDGLPQPQLNIDHHITNSHFAQINLIDETAVATTELLSVLLPEWGLPLTRPIADALLTGLITDTIGFRTNNMTIRALHVAANLMELGADLPELYRRALIQRSFSAIQFWGNGLSHLQRDGRIVWTKLTMEDRLQAGYPGRDDADLINVLSSITDTDIAIIFVEQPDGDVKVSWRAQGKLDVSGVAQHFGGGGHRAAAGATVPGPIDDVQASVLKVTQELIETV